MAKTRRKVHLPLADEVWNFFEKRLLVVINHRRANDGKPPLSTPGILAAVLAEAAIQNGPDVLQEYEKIMSRVKHIEFGPSTTPGVAEQLDCQITSSMGARTRSRNARNLPSDTLSVGCILPSRQKHHRST